jgi:predicted Zn-dependent protease
MGELLSKRPSELSTSDKQGFYAQSWLLTHYVMADEGRRKKFNVYLNEWRKTGDSVAAWKTAFGETPQELKRSLDRYRSKPLMGRIITRSVPSTPPMTITTLSQGADDVLLENVQLQISVAKARQPEMLQKVRSAYARRPNDRFTRLAAARAETKYGDRDAGEAILNTMIAADPKDYEAMMALAESHLMRGRADTGARGR